MAAITEKQKAVEDWVNPKNQDIRYKQIMELANDAGLLYEFNLISKLHFTTMSESQFLITVLALGKIREMRQLVALQPN